MGLIQGVDDQRPLVLFISPFDANKLPPLKLVKFPVRLDLGPDKMMPRVY